MAIDTHGDIYVADWLNDRVQMFNSEGRYVDQFIGDANLSKPGRQHILANTVALRLREMTDLESTRRLSAPNCVRVDSDFRLFICDVGQHRSQVYKVEKGKAGDQYPANSISVLMAMDRLAEITLVPRRRRSNPAVGIRHRERLPFEKLPPPGPTSEHYECRRSTDYSDPATNEPLTS